MPRLTNPKKLLCNCNVRVGTDHSITAIHATRYQDGNACVLVTRTWDDGTIEEDCRISVNIPPSAMQLDDLEFFLKDYSEAAETARALLEAGILKHEPPKRRVQTGFAQVPIVTFDFSKVDQAALEEAWGEGDDID